MGSGSTLVSSPTADSPIHCRCNADAPIVPGKSLPVLSCLWYFSRMLDGFIDEGEDSPSGTWEVILDKNMLSLLKI